MTAPILAPPSPRISSCRSAALAAATGSDRIAPVSEQVTRELPTAAPAPLTTVDGVVLGYLNLTHAGKRTTRRATRWVSLW